jgi:cell division septum initiation protein DivIVA
VLGGYSRAQVRLYLSELARELTGQDARIGRLEAELARARSELTLAESTGRSGLLRHLGAETAAILQAADASAERIRADAEATASRVREGLRAIGSNLGEVHQLMGELVAIMHGMEPEPQRESEHEPESESEPALAPAAPSCHTLNDHEPSRSTVPRFTGDQDVEILLPDDGSEPRFG